MSFRVPNYNQSGPTTTWKSEKQKTLVLARLINAGHDVSSETPPAECWSLLTDLLLSEIRR